MADEEITFGWMYGDISSGNFAAPTASGSVTAKVGNAVYLAMTTLALKVYALLI